MCPTTTRPPRRVLLGQLQHLADIHVIGAVANIEMHIEIDVVLAGKRKKIRSI